jgi:hypothetical protein
MRPLLLLSLLLGTLAGCSGNELIGLHVAVATDGSAVVTTRALVDNPTPGRTEVTTKGVAWTASAALQHSQGTATKLGEVQLGDGSLRFEPSADGSRVKVVIQRGPEVSWIRALAPTKDRRRALGKVYDPTGKTVEVADTVRLDVVCPQRVIASGVSETARGVTADRDDKRAFLVIPVQTALEAGADLVWDITW